MGRFWMFVSGVGVVLLAVVIVVALLALFGLDRFEAPFTAPS